MATRILAPQSTGHGAAEPDCADAIMAVKVAVYLADPMGCRNYAEVPRCGPMGPAPTTRSSL